jgi:D-lactate dehydrogenase (cytochrome)
VDPTSRTDATVGGAIACNASGFTPGEAGAMRHWIEALDVVLPDGRALHARRGQFVSENGRFVLRHAEGEIVLPVPRYPRPAIKNAGGPYSSPDGHMDFVDLVVGSEGLFGLVTACGLRLAHAPAGYLDLFFSLPDEANAVALRDYLAATLDGGVGSLTALEYFGVNCRRHMKHENVLFQGADAVGVYIQAPLAAADADVAAERWLEVLAASGCGVRDDAILTLDNDRDRAIFLEARHSLPASAVETVQRRGTFTIMTDTVVPPPRFPEFLRHTHDLIRSAGMDYLAFGHLGDCHLHFTLLPTQEQLDLGAALYDQIVAKSADLGGVYSGEHGTGRRKRNDFLKCYGAMAVEDVRRCKAALDPRFLLNAGNVIP